MCGLAGIVHLDGQPFSTEIDEPFLDRMGTSMAHRGPDDRGSLSWRNVGVHFRRLAINDLAAGRQPFTTADGRVSAFANGEIYNHRDLRPALANRQELRTNCDCELLPYLYLEHGLEMFAQVNGMFAAAILDRASRRLLLARDRLGEKPLFYCRVRNGRTLLFASELKALFAHPEAPRDLDWRGQLTRVQNVDLDAGERPAGFVGIERLAAGNLLDVDLESGRIETRSYWRLPQNRPLPETDLDTCIRGYRQLLAESVSLRLACDVGAGVFLSGGIDSAAVAALAAREAHIPTFTIHSAATLADASAARQVATGLGLPNHQLSFDRSAAKAVPDDWRRVLWTCEFADAGPEQYYKYYLHAFARRRYPDLKVILLGQGSDEFNGGYLGMILDRPPPYVDDDWTRMGDELLDRHARHRAFVTGLVGRAGHLIDEGIVRREFVLGADDREEAVWDTYVRAYRGNLDTHLWHEDRTAAAHSIENRVPFLDHRLVEFLAAVPERHHRALFTDKRILRLAVADLLPREIVHRSKGPLFLGADQHHAYRMVLDVLLKDDGELIEQAIAGSRLTDGPIDGDRLREAMARAAHDPELSSFGQLLDIVNMGILAYMAKTLEAPPPLAGDQPLPVHELAAAPSAAGSAGRCAWV